jgi:nucleoid DNA-binding protein
MDIDLLAKMVREIMMDHDSVTLPGLGSFAAEVVPASFSDKGYTINPPYRRLYFLPHQGSDTLLADLYSSSNNISTADATRILVEYLTEMKEVLVAKKIIVFPGLGRLRATRENHFFFVADEYLDIYPAGFGLEPISLKTHEESPEEVAQAVSSLAQMLEPEPVAEEPEPVVEEIPDQVGNDVVEEEPVQEKKKRRIPLVVSILKWVAVAALVALIALAVVGRVAPDWLDYYLYSPEELEILHSL